MSRSALRGIGQVIKANTTERSIDDLRAEGKKRVRVVSSERVMAIIQAIVDDTIASEVGEITKRDRDRIVTDTQERFSRVLRMQQGLEQDVEDLRGSLRGVELERDRLRADKALLEAQVESARRVDGESEAVTQIGRELARVRDAVERTSREPVVVDEAALSRVAEKLAARDSQSARRLGAEFDDLRSRIDSVSRDTAAARDVALEKALQRVKEQQQPVDPQLVARLDREFRTVTDRLAEIQKQVARAPAADDAVTRLRGDLDSIEKRILGVERSSSEMAERVSKAVSERIEARATAVGDPRGDEAGLQAAQMAEAVRRLQQSSDEARESVLAEMASLRESVDDARTLAMSVYAEQLRDVEQRVTDRASEGTEVLVRTVERLAERTSVLEESIQGLRGEFVSAVERAASAGAAAPAPAAVTEALVELRAEAAQAAAARMRTMEREATLSARLDAAVAELRADFMALTTRSIEVAERQHIVVESLREQIALSTTAQADSLQSTFKGSLELALDKITKAMKSATARTIETDGEATDVLVARMFDTPDGELTSNLGELEVEQRRSHDGIAKSIGRLNEMNGRTKVAAQ